MGLLDEALDLGLVGSLAGVAHLGLGAQACLVGLAALPLDAGGLGGLALALLAGDDLRGLRLGVGSRSLDLAEANADLLATGGQDLVVLLGEGGVDVTLDLLDVTLRGLGAQGVDETAKAVDDRGHVGRGVAAAGEGPVDDPDGAREGGCGEHVVLAGKLDLEGAGVVRDGIGLAGRDVAGDVGLGEELDGHVLEQVGKLGRAHAVLEGLAGITQADVVDDVRKQVVHKRGRTKVAARHERRVIRDANACG